jgi:hypothetical protein
VPWQIQRDPWVEAKKMDGVDDAYDKHGGYDQVMMIRMI